MIYSGMLSAGYEWILLDDCWSDHERDADGDLQADKSQFPKGSVCIDLLIMIIVNIFIAIL